MVDNLETAAENVGPAAKNLETGGSPPAPPHRDPPGLELSRNYQRVAEGISDPARKLLSWMASSLVRRGWLQPIDKSLEAAAEMTEMTQEALKSALDELMAAGLVELDGARIATVAGLLSTRPTGIDFVMSVEHTVHVLGPMAALAVAIALQKSGEIRSQCPVTGKRLVLVCDVSGVASRDPETICAFVGAWDGSSPRALSALAGGLFADDDALGKWQEDKADPAGMPMASFLFPMAATDLGLALGKALEATLNHLPDYA